MSNRTRPTVATPPAGDTLGDVPVHPFAPFEDGERKPQLVLRGSAVDRDWGHTRTALYAASLDEEHAHVAMAFGASAGRYLTAREAWLRALATEHAAYSVWVQAADLQAAPVRAARHPELSNYPDGAIDPTGEGEA